MTYVVSATLSIIFQGSPMKNFFLRLYLFIFFSFFLVYFLDFFYFPLFLFSFSYVYFELDLGFKLTMSQLIYSLFLVLLHFIAFWAIFHFVFFTGHKKINLFFVLKFYCHTTVKLNFNFLTNKKGKKD